MKSLTLDEITKAVKGELNNKKYADYTIADVSIDSRNEMQGKLFIPIVGERFDGHDYIPQVFEKGAVCCLSEINIRAEKPVILVKSTKDALKDLAMYYVSLFPIQVVAITGSVGKTTTKDLIANVLAQKYKVLKTEGNFNNEIGLPLTIFRLEEGIEVLVLEMGMNNFGEIHNLSCIAKPDIGVITNIGVAHIENLKSREGILKAKCEIFDFLKPNGIIILNGDDDLLETLENKYTNIKFFGINKRQDFYGEITSRNGLNGIGATITSKTEAFHVDIPLPGEHMVLNSLAAAAVGKTLGLTTEQIKTGIEQFVPSKNRMDIIRIGGLTIINDVYNASPTSMKAALDVLDSVEGKKIAILGDMFELGEFSDEMHHELGKYIQTKNINTIMCIGEAARHIQRGIENVNEGQITFGYPNLELFLEETEQDGAIGYSQLFEEKNATVLIKASRGMKFEKIIEKLLKHSENNESGLK